MLLIHLLVLGTNLNANKIFLLVQFGA